MRLIGKIKTMLVPVVMAFAILAAPMATALDLYDCCLASVCDAEIAADGQMPMPMEGQTPSRRSCDIADCVSVAGVAIASIDPTMTNIWDISLHAYRLTKETASSAVLEINTPPPRPSMTV